MELFKLDDVEEREPIPGYRGRFVHSAHTSVAHWKIAQGATMPGHAHPHEQVVNVIEGRFEMTVQGKKHLLTAGTVLVIPGNVPHGGVALTDCHIIDVFHPVREDYK
jgi:quercetin dioxygenase-like cupin family protein